MSKHSARGAAWNAQRQRVLQRDGHQCVYCNAEATEVDHVVAISLNPEGTYSDDQLVASCKPCNASKGAKPLVRTHYRSPRWF